MSSIGELIIKAAMPKGVAWKPKPNGNYDKILQGIGEIIDLIIDNTDNLREVRNPLLTEILNDLEREFGVLTNSALTDTERRLFLSEKKKNSIINGNPEGLQEILQKVDAGLFVYQNNPPVDPQPFIDQGFIIINNGRGDSTGGVIPTEDWPLLFFVGGVATRNVGGEIISMAEVILPIEKEEFATKPIVSYKGLYTWAVAKFLVGEKYYLVDAVDNQIVDGDGNNVYVVGV